MPKPKVFERTYSSSAPLEVARLSTVERSGTKRQTGLIRFDEYVAIEIVINTLLDRGGTIHETLLHASVGSKRPSNVCLPL